MAELGEEERAGDEIEREALAIEAAVLLVICSRLGNFSDMTSAYAAMPEDLAEIRRIMARGSASLAELASGIMEDMAISTDEWAAPFYADAGIGQTEILDDPLKSRTVRNAGKTASDSIKAVCNTSMSGIVRERVVNGRKIAEYVDVSTAYRQAVTDAAHAMMQGEQSYDRAVRQIVGGLSKSGLKVYYEHENGTKTIRSLHSAARMNTMDAYRSAMIDLRMQAGDEFGADGVEVSAHGLCARDHLHIQGRRYNMADWERVEARLDRPIGKMNCRHFITPVRMGVSARAYTEEQLAEIRESSTKMVTFKGLSGKEMKMTRYEASQYQRAVERAARDQATDAKLLKAAGVSNSDAMAKARQYRKFYAGMCSQAGLEPRYDLMRSYV